MSSGRMALVTFWVCQVPNRQEQERIGNAIGFAVKVVLKLQLSEPFMLAFHFSRNPPFIADLLLAGDCLIVGSESDFAVSLITQSQRPF